MTDPLPPRPDGQDRPPRPRYGEYATPEEQQRRMQANPLPVPPPAPAAGPAAQRVPVAGARPSTGRIVDRIATIGLLAYGLVNTVVSVPQMIDYAAYAENMLALMGVGVSLTDPVGARGWGVAAALVLGLGWLATALLSYLRLRARKVAFWIPLVGAVVFVGIAGVLVVIPLVNDPAVLDALTRVGTP